MPRSRKLFDIGLAISGATLSYGQTRTQREIAAYCGCTYQRIGDIERAAIRKIRRHIISGYRSGKITMSDLAAVLFRGETPEYFSEIKEEQMP